MRLLRRHMHSLSTLSFFFITTILLVFYHLKCDARDSINVANPLNGSGEILISTGNRFALGFFTPEGNERNDSFVGIWYYKLVPRTIVWVANRDNPVFDSCGVFGIDAENGNLKIWCNEKVVVSITDLETSTTFNGTLQLLDSGNLILFDARTTLWQSFDVPTDTFLPGMEKSKLTSWISPSDPSPGDYTFQGNQGVYSIQNRSTVYWQSGEHGPRGTFFYNELPYVVAQMLVKGDSYCSDSRLVMNSSGKIQYYCNSSFVWFQPENFCSEYDACGKFGLCNALNKSIMCQCLKGFKPTSSEDWKAGTYSDGCERESKHTPDDEFVSLTLMKIGGQVTFFDQAQEEAACRKECLNNHKCEAYIYKANPSRRDTANSVAKCCIWADLENLQINYTNGGFNLSLRVPRNSTSVPLKSTGVPRNSTTVPLNSTGVPRNSAGLANWRKGSGRSKNNSRTIYAIVLTILLVGVVLVLCSSYILHRRRRMVDGSGTHIRENSTL